MTTTVYDSINGMITCDSRWSMDHKDPETGADLVAYVDDTGFGKLALWGTKVISLAGNGLLIEEWKNWWKTDHSTPHPPVSREQCCVQLYVIDALTNKLEFAQNLNCTYSDPILHTVRAVFSGSGQTHALSAWQVHKCAMRSIFNAMEYDLYTGGSVRFVNFNKRTYDIEDSVSSIADVHRILLERGYVMDKHDPKGTARKISDSAIKGINAMVASGELQLSAPTSGEVVVWDQESIGRLEDYLRSIKQEADTAKQEPFFCQV